MRNRWAIGLFVIAMFMQVGWAFAQDSETPTVEESVIAEETTTQEPVEAEPAVEATEIQGIQYIVQPGDNLFRIALRFNVPLTQLAAANGITNPALIYVGQVLTIPGTTPVAPTEEPTEEQTEEVTEESTEEVTEEPTEEPTEEVTEEPTEEPTATETPQPVTDTYRVQRGDTLYTIAVRFGTTISELVNLNNLANANVIYSGQVLRVPSAGSTPATPAPAPTEAPVTTEEPTQAPAKETTPDPTAEPVVMQPGIEVFVTGEDVSALVSQTQQVSVEWVKITVNWRDVETEQGHLNLAEIDAAVDAFNAGGINILLQLTGAPDWARPSASEFVLASSEYGPPNDLSLFGTFASSVATRYGSKVQAYQIWNEPNLRRNWIDATTTDRSNAKLSGISYIDLLTAAYGAIKSANPSALVISAGLAPTGLNDGVNAFDDRQYLQNMLAGGLADVSDGVGVHPDGFANPPDARSPEQAPGVDTHFDSPRFFFLDTLDEYHTILEAAGDTDPLWVTRFGWGTAEGNALVQPNEFNIFLTYTSPQEQALYTVRAFELGNELGYVGPMILFNLNGCAAGIAEACYYSLVDSSVSARPVFNSLESVQTAETGE